MTDTDILFAIICSTLVVLLLVAALVIVFFIAGKQRMKQQFEMAQTRIVFEQELRQVETEVSEHVLHKFAQELHDNIGQLLTAMHFQIENQKIDHPQLTEGLKPVEIYLGEVTQQLRLLSHTMNYDYLGHIGLFAAMQTEVDRLRALKRLQIHWIPVQGISNLDKNQELMVFRIFQEITQNALRHSGASNLYITVKNEIENFELKIRDDGKGFNPEQTLQSQKSSGLRNIRKRAELAGLNCEIISSPEKGCQIIVKKSPALR